MKQATGGSMIRCAAMLLTCMAAVLLREAIAPLLGDQAPFVTFTLAVLVIAWFGGARLGLATTALCVVLADYYAVPPTHSFRVPALNWQLSLLSFVVVSLFINGMFEYRRQAERREAKLSDRFHRILAEMPAGVLIISPDGYIAFANRAAAQLYGLTPALMMGRTHDDAAWGVQFRDGAQADVGLPYTPALAAAGQTVRAELRATGAGGEEIRLLASAVALAGRENDPGEVLICLSDPAAQSTPDEQVWLDAMRSPVPKNPAPVLYLDHTAKLSGGEIALARLLGSLDRARYRPIVLLGEDGPLVAHLREIDVETHVLPLAGRVRNIRKDTLGLGALRRLEAAWPLLMYTLRVARFARRHRISVIHTNSLKSDLYGALAGRLARIPVVWHVRDHIDPSYLPGAAVHLFRLLARVLPTYVVANSESTRERLFLSDARPSAVVPSGLDMRQTVIPDGLGRQEMPDAGEDAPRVWSGPIRIGIVGRLASWKGQHVFLEALSRLRLSGYDIEGLIVGSALFGEENYENELRRQVASSGLADRVQFLGFRKDVSAVLHDLDILVHASTTPEPFGQVVIEGMAEGLPVVATDGGGVREIVTHAENGLLVPMGDAAALTDALARLIADPAEAGRLGHAAFWHVRRHFTAAQSARRVEKVYADVLAEAA